MAYWLLKSEPDVYSIEDLRRDCQTHWEGVRNYQARNFLRDQIKKDDWVFFYHSNAEPSGIAGIAAVTRAGYPEPEAFERSSRHYDSKNQKEKPVWFAVDIRFVRKFKAVIPFETLLGLKDLKHMPLLRRGQRLSVQPVSATEWKKIIQLAA